MVDDLLVYRGDNHIMQSYAAFLTPVVKPWLQRAIAGAPMQHNGRVQQ